jgi:hypothetical protein
MFLVANNFLYVNNENYSIIVCFFKIVTIIIASRKLVRMGRKFYLFVYYVKLISCELWMVEECVTLNGGLDIWTMKGLVAHVDLLNTEGSNFKLHLNRF